MSNYQPLQTAIIDWEDNIPSCRSHNDIYFSSDSGVDETHHVFLAGNNLPQRWQEKENFTIAETGFGTGLNFLCTVDAWQKTAPPQARLHYISIEKYPLDHKDLKQALQQWPEFQAGGTELLNNYPAAINGFHRRILFNGRITLTLLFGDVADMLNDLDAEVDAWYLDGFAPSKNPDMWTTALFKQISRLTRPGGSFATFTAAGSVRRGLQAAGFTVATRPGFGRKRDMLHGHLNGKPAATNRKPWFARHAASAGDKNAVIIGAGLSGCSTAHTLACRGWQVTVIERHPQVAREASGNLAGVVMPRITADMSIDGRFCLSAFFYTTYWLNQLKKDSPDLPWHASGVLQLMSEEQACRLQKLALPHDVLQTCDAKTATDICGTATSSGGIFYPGGGWLSPALLCQWLLKDQADNIRLVSHQEALKLERQNRQWQVQGANGLIAEAKTIVLANGYDAQQFIDNAFLKLQEVRGQIAYLAATTGSRQLKTAVCYNGYLIPASDGLHCAGATYDLHDKSVQIKDQDQNEILAALKQQLPKFDALQAKSGRAALRAATQDHLPLIGPVPVFDDYKKDYHDLKHGKAARHYPSASYQPGMFISTGHGSRGLISCPLAAEIIAATLNHEPLPIAQDLLDTIHPARFLVRQLKRGKA